MKLAVTGASGTLGRAVVRAGVAAGHDVTAIVRSRKTRFPPGVRLRDADIVSGLALRDALEGSDVVIDAFNVRNRKALVGGTRRILEAAAAAGVKHFVGISIIGCDRVHIPYHRAKVEQEHVIESSPIPWSMVRATPFFDLLDKMFSFSVLGVHVVPSTVKTQPVSVDEVAAELVRVADGKPQGIAPEFAGPEIMTMGDAFEVWRRAHGGKGIALPLPVPGKLGQEAREGALCNPARAMGRQTLADWLEQRSVPITTPAHAT